MGRRPKSHVDTAGRVCLTCTKYKSWNHFHKGKGSHGYVPRCKLCMSAVQEQNQLGLKLVPAPRCYWCELVLEDSYIWGTTQDEQPLCGKDCEKAYKRHMEILEKMRVPVSNLRLGDVVRVTGVSPARPELRGLETGTITNTARVLGLDWTVTFPDGTKINYAERELKLVAIGDSE